MHVNMEPYTKSGNIAAIICHDFIRLFLAEELDAYGSINVDAIFTTLRDRAFTVFPTEKELYDSRDNLAYVREIPLISARRVKAPLPQPLRPLPPHHPPVLSAETTATPCCCRRHTTT